ncbi:hypothetical protein D3C79_714790 [compost metagenome]
MPQRFLSDHKTLNEVGSEIWTIENGVSVTMPEFVRRNALGDQPLRHCLFRQAPEELTNCIGCIPAPLCIKEAGRLTMYVTTRIFAIQRRRHVFFDPFQRNAAHQRPARLLFIA